MTKYLAVFMVLTGALIAETPEEKGVRIATELSVANDGFVGERSQVEMVLINAHGDRTVRKMINEIREKEGDGDQSISTFLWPADVKGTRMLTWSHKTGDDDQWLYLPALKRVKRISSRNKSGAFMGSEFSYEDLGSQEVEEFHHKFLEDTKVDGRDVWKLERIPVSKRSGYSKEVGYFDKEYMNPLRIEYYDRKGELLKIATFVNYQKIDKWWRASAIHMENVQTKKKSELSWSERQLGQTYSEDHFHSENLVE